MNDYSHRVLFVDDNDDVRETSADMLTELGYSVVQAASASEALDRLEQHPDLDVMITDVLMPGMSGFELCDLVSSRYEHVKLVVISGYFLPQAGQRRFVRKPFRTGELDDAIQAVLAG